MTEKKRVLSSDELIKQARSGLVAADLVREAREQLDIVDLSEDMERHNVMRTARVVPTVGEALQARDMDTAPVIRSGTSTEPAFRERRVDTISPSHGRMIRTEDRIPSGPMLETKRRSAFSRLLLIVAGVGVAVALLGSVFAEEESTPTSTAAPAAVPASAGTSVSVDNVAAGMCIQQPPGDVFLEVESVPCTQAHDFEIIGTIQLPGTQYPGDDAVYDEAIDACIPLFETYVDISYAESIWYLNAFTPTEKAWAAGDQSATCMVFQFDNANNILRMNISARGDGR